jgi:chemotaxis protein MotB
MPLRVRRHTVEEKESYFVSMTDLMVGLLFIFIIMLMVFALQYREAERTNIEAEQVIKKQLSDSSMLTKCATKS